MDRVFLVYIKKKKPEILGSGFVKILNIIKLEDLSGYLL